jgi:hypothetical protein
MRPIPIALALAALAATSPSAQAAESADAQRMAAMEKRLADLEAQAQQLRTAAADALAAAQAARAELAQIRSAATPPAAAPAPPPPAATASAGANAFNPAISLILNGVYGHHSTDVDSFMRPGFPFAGEAGPGPRGLGIGESEISFAANIDDKFYGQFTASFDSDGGSVSTNIEEAYIETTALPAGWSVRAGRFFANLGYLNSHHAHTDNFVDRPLAYQAFLGGQYGDDGIDVHWLAPTDLYLELGGELLRGDAYPAAGAGNGGIGSKVLYAHLGGDAGDNASWLAGVSYLRSRSEGGDDGFVGDGDLVIADATWKWAPNGNTKDGGVTLRSEFMVDRREGRFVDPESLDSIDGRFVRRGGYLESVLRLSRQWDVGYRYDRLWSDRDLSGPDSDAHRHSLMLTWRNSEFSLLRLQLMREDAGRGNDDSAALLQYQVSLGAHGAHKF